MYENLITLFAWLILFALPLAVGAWWTDRKLVGRYANRLVMSKVSS